MQQIRIAIDGNEANVKNRVGSNVYAFEIINALEKISRKRDDLSFEVILSSKKVKDLPKRRKNWNYKLVLPEKLWTQWALPLYLFKNRKNYDVFFTPGHYAPRICPVPYVSSVMDLAFLEYPNQFRKRDLLQLKNWTKYSVRNAKKVITISQFSKTAIHNAYGKPIEDIVVAYPSVDKKYRKLPGKFVAEVFEKFELGDNFLFSLSTLQPRKNLVKLIEAFNQVSLKLGNNSLPKKFRGRKSQISKVHQLELVIAGKIGWLASEILEAARKSPFSDRIIFTGFINEDEKQVLFEHSLASVSLSPYEGFGIPALEALKFGTIPIVANNSSLPEVVDSAGIQVDPHNIDNICESIESVLNLSAYQRAKCRRLGREQLDRFDWMKSGETILNTLESLK